MPDQADHSGAVLFVRYAYPPNARGYCGPDDNGSFLAYGQTGAIDAGFVELAQAFTGAWPYLEIISGVTQIPDPLDRRVVEAYWVGNELLDQVGPEALGTTMEDRFQRSVGRVSAPSSAGAPVAAFPHHSYHVFCVYPWVGMLGHARMRERALDVLEQCRIRWARVVEVAGAEIVVECEQLTYDTGQLALGPARSITATTGSTGPAPLDGLMPGDWVSVHWDWVCDRLDDHQVEALRRHTLHHLALANARLSADPSSSGGAG